MRKQRILVQSPRFVPSDTAGLSPALQQPLRLQKNWFCVKACHHKAQTNTSPWKGVLGEQGKAWQRLGYSAPVVARALHGVSLPQWCTALSYALSATLHKEAPAFPPSPSAL